MCVACGSCCIAQAAAALISIVMAGKILEVPYRRIGRAIAAPLGAALGMGAVVFPIAEVVESNWAALLAGAAAGVTVYTGLLRLLAPHVPDRLLGGLISRISRRAPVGPGTPIPPDR